MIVSGLKQARGNALFGAAFGCGRSQASDRSGKLLEHPRPAELRPLDRLIALRQGEVEARVLKKEARAVAIKFESVGHPRIDDRSASIPKKHEPTGRFALQHCATHD